MFERSRRRRVLESFAAVFLAVPAVPRVAMADPDAELRGTGQTSLPPASASARPAQAAGAPPQDTAAPPRRALTLEWNALALLLQRASINVEIAAAEHHAIVLTPFYFYPRTSRFSRPDPAHPGASEIVESQRFQGFGGEIGYRYYGGGGGLRGAYVGPSIFAMFPTATAGNGQRTSFADYGVAADVGYQALVASRWVVSVGGGVQYTFVSRSLPDQQLPAGIYANRGFLPRLDFSLGCAF